jgi:uncharacterized protein (DUF427 family)
MGFTNHIRNAMQKSDDRVGARPMQAVWNGAVIAESYDTVVVDGSHCFPEQSLNFSRLAHSDKTSVCPWKGRASYYDVVVDDRTNVGAAWTYPSPKAAAAQLECRVAFWKGVEVHPAD